MKLWSFDKIIIFSAIVFLIPVAIDDAHAKTVDIVMPIGAANPTGSLHFLNSEVTVSVNDKIRWINFDYSSHTVTSGSFQGGPDGIFNSGILEKDEVFTYIADPTDIGSLSYYCTLHPWMNGIITVSDPEGMAVGRIAESGSIDAALAYIEEAESFVTAAIDFGGGGYDNQAAVSYNQAAIKYHDAAIEYSLLDEHEDAAKYHHEAAIQHYNAAVHFEKWKDFTQSVLQHFKSGVQHHFAGVSYEMMGDDEKARQHFAESMLHKRMSKFGSDYVMPPRHQLQWLGDPSHLECRGGLEILYKSTTKTPVCVKPESAEALVSRGWGQY